MQVQLQAFPFQSQLALNVFCPNEHTVVTSFETHLPDSKDVGELSGGEPDLPASLCWLEEYRDYYAYPQAPQVQANPKVVEVYLGE